ncbi:large conductance mechanosensitive channel protein MscL [Nitratifractor salsuginis]|uniref:Large-conductance mechanosensitive channel n=1 Tax=Nitratifractor salsuginis (strain DSM 16511 / JCM 12458 / E9I37-1) TaxID=749222 RepID=E6X174_NITSE|nr:large conductance mechanosensitive channel protein MscL [Nitratifractor salsuginis]ADV46936.1 large conductance mechanosensitive channel protein [Nitratifractor salsuginis DSM 16511]
MWKDFKEFLIKGNMVDMAVGFIFGAAFATVVKSMVNNIIMPPLGLLLGKVDFSQLFIPLDGKHYPNLEALDKAGAPAIKYGLFINDFVSFVILGFVVFIFVRYYNRLTKKEEVVEEATTKKCPECAMEIPIEAKKCPYCESMQP